MKTSNKKRSASCQPTMARAPRPRAAAESGSANPGKTPHAFRMFLIPCSCGTTFAVADNYDHHGTAWSRYMTCPSCGKRHDPKNRLLQMGFHPEGYWKVDDC